MLTHVELFELLALLFALRCTGCIPWDLLLKTFPCVNTAASWLVMGGRELLEFRDLFHPVDALVEEAQLILESDRSRFAMLSSELLTLLRNMWNSHLTCFSLQGARNIGKPIFSE
jgi:hypothetical protein